MIMKKMMIVALMAATASTAFAGDSPELKSILKAKTYAEAASLVNSSLGQLIATKEGLWQSITFWDEDLNNEKKTYDSMQQVLLPVPVL